MVSAFERVTSGHCHDVAEHERTRAGGCLCGAIRYSVRGKPIHVGRCHCADCRKESGSAFSVYAQWPRNVFELRGHLAAYDGRGFCARGGSRVACIDEDVVEIPGLIEGAHEGRGGARPLLGVLRGADAILFCQDVSTDVEITGVMAEVQAAGIDRPAAVAATKADEAQPGAVARLRSAFPELEVVPVSVLDEDSLDRLRDVLWRLTGLVRVYVRGDNEPFGLRPPVSVEDVAHVIHHELGERCEGARLWGPSARFPGQRVGRTHSLADGDTVEILG